MASRRNDERNNRKILSLIQHQQGKIDRLGKWMAQRFSNKKKAIVIIPLCRMPQGKNQGIQTSIFQHDQMRGEMISATRHKKETFKDMIEYFK